MFDAEKYKIDNFVYFSLLYIEIQAPVSSTGGNFRLNYKGATYQVFSLIPSSSNRQDLFPNGVQVQVLPSLMFVESLEHASPPSAP